MNTLMFGDCLKMMDGIADESIDLVLADLPYQITQNKWDEIIPFEPLWKQYKRVLKKTGSLVFHAGQPFTSKLIMSNVDWFKYSLVWKKSRPTGFLDANRKPLKEHEDICVFSPNGYTTYNPQGVIECEKKSVRVKMGDNFGKIKLGEYIQKKTNYPRSVLTFASESNTLHPTQKPLALTEYLILTYSNEGETILDNVFGSGTTGIACYNTKRNFIGIEKDPKYFDLGQKRINNIIFREH